MNNPSFIAVNFSATQGPFDVKKGVYTFSVVGTFSSGSVSLEQLAADGSTYVIVKDAFGNAATISAAGETVVALSEGQYEFVVGGSPSAMYASLAPVN